MKKPGRLKVWVWEYVGPDKTDGMNKIGFFFAKKGDNKIVAWARWMKHTGLYHREIKVEDLRRQWELMPTGGSKDWIKNTITGEYVYLLETEKVSLNYVGAYKAGVAMRNLQKPH